MHITPLTKLCQIYNELITYGLIQTEIKKSAFKDSEGTFTFKTDYLPSDHSQASFAPTVRVTNFEHGRQNVVPGLLLHHRFVGEHTSIPADVLEGFGEIAVLVAQPETGIAGDIEFPVGIEGQAMPSGFVVRTGPKHRGIILSHVEIDGPRTQGGGQLTKSIV